MSTLDAGAACPQDSRLGRSPEIDFAILSNRYYLVTTMSRPSVNVTHIKHLKKKLIKTLFLATQYKTRIRSKITYP